MIDPIALAAEHSYGYGRWDGRYWFIGPEPGQAQDERKNLLSRCEAWLTLRSENADDGALIDNVDHHKLFNLPKWHRRVKRMKLPINQQAMRPPLQRTWRPLILTLLAFKGERVDPDAIGDYQASRWGTVAKNGETCVVEISALASNSLMSDPEIKKQYVHFRDNRAKRLRQEVEMHHPKFVLMYGGGKTLLPSWRRIACGDENTDCFKIENIEGIPAGFSRQGKTVFVHARHPRGLPDAYWKGIAGVLRMLAVP